MVEEDDNGLPLDWPDRRETVKERDDYTCQNWGSSGKDKSWWLVVHHIVPKEEPEGTHRLSDLITLCQQCHHAVHRQ